uniref:Serpin domain-containing protein n=1 Tax=Stomoxys calcitrans TaxID=35570 RepID=A0A1I8Q9D6_STOCA
MTRMGAAGATETETNRTLGFGNLPVENVKQNFHSILTKYEKGGILKLANKIYVAQGQDLLNEYNEVLLEKFFSSAENLDFTKGENAVKVVNNWVANKTDNMIVDFMPPNSFSPLTVMVLLSAIYFQGTWEKSFMSILTREKDFFIDETHAVKVAMMHSYRSVEYAQYPDLQA